MEYETTLARAGRALGGGAGLGGLLVLVLAAAAGQHHPLWLLLAWLIGSVFSALALTAVAGPVWLALHLSGRRRAWHAATLTALLALVIFIGGRSYGFGSSANLSLVEEHGLLYRMALMLAATLVVAVGAGLIGLVMWRIAYRPVRQDRW